MKTSSKGYRTKRYVAVLMCVMMSTFVRSQEEECRTFSDAQGHTFKGRLVDYETASETVVVKRRDGKKGRMPLARFSDADRLYILDWGASRHFLQGLELMPKLSSVAVSKEESGGADAAKKVFDVFYEICFVNRVGVPFEQLDFEYCIFYKQGERKGRNVHYEEGVCYGKGAVDLLDPSSEQVSKTKPIRLYTEGGPVSSFGAQVISLANVSGIWLRLKTKLPSGSEIMREYRTSEDAEWKWAPYSFGAGLNEGENMQTYYFVK